MGNELVIDASRGTALWGINLFRADALSQLMNDLLYREKVGLLDEQCDKVKLALGEVVNVASSIPDGSWFRGAIWQELQDFADIYTNWNSHYGNDPAIVQRRQLELRKLRDKRNRIARRIRKNQHVLQNELDLRLVDNMYAAFGKLVHSLPDVFVNLAKAIERFTERKP
jgi:hypothetical protein